MDLEQRVQMLEQELAILKSQIQATLLDIQEQLLTNAYPALRASAPPQKPTTAATPDAPAPIIVAGRRAAKAEIIIEDEDEDEDDGPTMPSIVKRVTLEGAELPAAKPPTVKAKGGRSAISDDEDKPKPAGRGKAIQQPVVDDDDDEDDYEETPAPAARPIKSSTPPAKPGKNAKNARNTKNVQPDADDEPDESVDQEDLAVFGRFATPKVLPTAKPDGKLDVRPTTYPQPPQPSADEWAEIWPEIWPEDDASPLWPPKLAVPDALTPPPATTSLTFSNSPDWTSLNRLAEWVGNKVKEVGIGSTKDIIEANAQRGTFSPEVKAALTQLVALYDEDGALNTVKIDAALEGLNKPPEVDPEDTKAMQQSETSRLVLRLIAGVQNAGAGIPRKKK